MARALVTQRCSMAIQASPEHPSAEKEIVGGFTSLRIEFLDCQVRGAWVTSLISRTSSG